jgi:type I restriction enzyme S subunit
MNEHELLERHFDIALETPDGIKKLRELILSLAMKGKLVSQDTKDQPAAELLEKIEVERQRLIKEGKIRKQEALPSLKSEDIYYELPRGWEWCYLNDLCLLITDGTHQTPNYVEKGIPFLSVKNLSSGYIDFSNTKFISIDEHNELTKRCSPEQDDILLTKIGTTGIAVTVNTNQKFSIFVSVSLLKLFNKYVYSEFITMLINSPLVKKYSAEGTEGVGNKNLVLRKIKSFIIPLPPLAEQKRIVKKIDELMVLCDKLEAERNERDKSKIKIHSTAMNRLLSAPDSTAFNSSWSFIAKHFSELSSVTQNVDELKKAILQLAVMGKLVPQDDNDQPASELLKEIEKEKQKLVKEGKIKKQVALPPIKQDEVPFELPQEWKWVRLREICHDWGQKTPDERFTYIDVGSIDNVNGYVTSEVQILESTEAPSRARKIVKKGTVIYSTVRPYLLNIAIIDHDYNPEPIASTAFAILHPYKKIYNKYIYYYLRSQPFVEYVELQMKGVAYPAINDGNFYMGSFPLPPFNEQKRIVEKIDQLMELCNSLEQQIKDSTGKKSEILVAVLSRV